MALVVRKSITIYEKNKHFHVKHEVENISDTIILGAIWAITCLIPEGTIFIPWGAPGKTWDLKKIVYWQKWMDHETDCNNSQYIKESEFVLIKPNGTEGKIGTTGEDGYIGVTNKDYTFIKKFNRLPGNNYPDDNCAIECYTCDKFIELETLSPIYSILPGIPIFHEEEWILIDRPVTTDHSDQIRKLLV